MKFDGVYQFIGEFGVYQLCVVAATTAICLWTADSINMVFVGGAMDHWCGVEELAHLPFERQKYIAIPGGNDERASDAAVEGSEYSSCRMYAFNYSRLSEDDLRNWNRSERVNNETETVECSRWVYDQSTFASTIISRFELVCGRDYMNQLISSFYMLGGVVGSVGAGAVADRFGRQSTTMIFKLIHCVGAILSCFAPNYVVMVIGRFLLGAGVVACFNTAYVLAMETVGPSYRTVVATVLQIANATSFMLQSAIAYYIRDDVRYQIAALAPNFLLLLFALVLPESLRWLAVAGKYHRADDVLSRICDVNQTRVPDDFDVRNFDDLSTDVHGEANFRSLLQNRKMRIRSLVVVFIWFTCSSMYFGLSLNTGSLPGSIYINTFISGAVEVPALLLANFLMGWKVTGRRLTCCLSFLVAGVTNLLCIPLILFDYEIALTTLSMIGKSSITMSFSVIYVLTSESFPTEVRSVGLGIGSMSGGVGSILAPYIGLPLAKLWSGLPSLVFGVLATSAGLVCLLLSETLGKSLPDTVQQIEDDITDSVQATAVNSNVICVAEVEVGESPCKPTCTSPPSGQGAILRHMNSENCQSYLTKF